MLLLGYRIRRGSVYSWASLQWTKSFLSGHDEANQDNKMHKSWWLGGSWLGTKVSIQYEI